MPFFDKSKFSDRANRLESAAIHRTKAVIAERKARGLESYNFVTGAVEFSMPEALQQRSDEVLHKAVLGDFGAVGGQADTIDAILAKFERENGIKGSRNQVIVCNGGKEVLSQAVEVLVNKGDEVVVFAPFWPSYESFIKREGGTPVFVQPDPESMKVTPEKLAAAITDKTKVVIINNPQNPGGAVYTKEELEAFAKVIEPTKAAVIADECFELFNYSGHTLTSFATLPGMAERSFTVNGIGKSYGKPGLRIGYGIGPEELVKTMRDLQSSGATHANVLGQVATAFLLNEVGQTHVPELDSFVKKNRDIMISGLKAIPQIKVHTPDSNYFAFPDVSGCFGMRTPTGKTLKTSQDVCDFMLDNGIVALDGKYCGMDGHIRMAFTLQPEQIEAGMQAMQAAFKTLVRVPGAQTELNTPSRAVEGASR